MFNCVTPSPLGKLRYFPVMAKGLPLAMVAETSGADWEGIVVQLDQWADLKASGIAPFGQLPLLQTPSGTVVGQCTAIVQYIVRKTGNGGSTEKEQVMSDMLLAEGEDLYGLMQKYNDTMFVKDKVSKEELTKFWCGEGKSTAKDHLARLENLIGATGFTSSGQTAGEVYLFGILYQMYLCKSDFIAEFTKLTSWFNGLLASDPIQKVVNGETGFGKLQQYFQNYNYTAKHVGTYNVSADKVWALLSDFTGPFINEENSNGATIEGVTGPQGVGQTRTIVMGDSSWGEKVSAFDADKKEWSYVLTSELPGPFAVFDCSNFECTMKVKALGADKCTVECGSIYNHVEGADPEKAPPIAPMYASWVEAAVEMAQKQ